MQKETTVNNIDTAKVNELIGWLADSVKGSGEFVKEQAPEVAQQMVAWGAFCAAMWLAICVVLALLAAFVMWRLDRAYPGDAKAPDSAVVGFMVSLCVIVACLLGAALNGGTLAKTQIAPKLYVLERVRGMLK